MKRIIAIIMAVLAILPAAYAQEGLHVTRFFSQDFMSTPGVSGLNINNEVLNKMGISLYRSVSVNGVEQTSADMEKAVKKDGVSALTREVSYRDGKLYFGCYALPPDKNGNRYLLYLNRTVDGQLKTTMIYLEGKCDQSTINKLLKK